METALVRYKVSCKMPSFNCWSYCSGDKNVQGINKMGKETVFKHVSSYIFSDLFHHILVERYKVSYNTLHLFIIIQLAII